MRDSFLLIRFILPAVLLIAGCATEPVGSLYDENDDSNAPPVISEILTADPLVLAGVDVLTINGSNFAPEAENNGVMFNDTRAEVLSASPTQLTVRAPVVSGDSIVVKIWAFNADEFSNSVIFRMEFATDVYYSFLPIQAPYAIAMDQDDNMFISLVANGIGQGIKRITPSGELHDHANKGGETFYLGLKAAPQNMLICARGFVRALFNIPEKTGADPVNPATWFVSGTSSLKLIDLDLDSDLNVWAAGENDVIIRIKEDTLTGTKTEKAFDFVGDVRSVRIFEDYIYLGGEVSAEQSVWRAPVISADSLGAFTQYFSLAAVTGYETGRIYAITFSEDGYMYVGTDGEDPILEVVPGGSAAQILYPGLLPSEARYFTWGSGTNLYYTRGVPGDPNRTVTIIRVNIRKNSAPYYGRGDI